MSTDGTIDVLDLISISADNRFGQIADAVDKIAANNERTANAFEAIARLIGLCVEVVEPETPGGVTRANFGRMRQRPFTFSILRRSMKGTATMKTEPGMIPLHLQELDRVARSAEKAGRLMVPQTAMLRLATAAGHLEAQSDAERPPRY